MGEGCRVLSGRRPAARALRAGLAGALHSPHELRVESRDAIPRLAAWLAERQGVTFLPRAAVIGVETGPGAHPGRFGHRGPHRGLPRPGPRSLVPGGPCAARHHAVQAAYAAGRRSRLAAAGGGDERSRAGALSRAMPAAPSLPALRARLEAEQADLACRRHPPDRGAGRRRLAGGRRQPPLCRQPGPVPAARGGRPDAGRACRPCWTFTRPR